MNLNPSTLCLSLAIVFCSSVAYTEQVELTSAAIPVVQVNQLEFIGNSVFDNKQLNDVVKDQLGRKMQLQDLQKITTMIGDFYRKNGFSLVRVIIPKQEFSDNVPVEIIVLEGNIDTIEIIGNQNYKEDKIKQVLANFDIKETKPVHLENLSKSLTLLKEIGAASAKSVLKPGKNLGETTLVIKLEEPKKVDADLEINNFGSKNTGEYRVQGNVKVNNLTGNLDTLLFSGLKTLEGEGVYNLRAAYSTPIGFSGASLGVYATKGNVQVGDNLSVLDIQGDTTGYGLGLNKNKVLSSTDILNYGLWFESLDANQSILGEHVYEDKVRKLRIDLNREKEDSKGKTFYALNVHQGLGDMLGGMENNSTLSSRAISGADNSFTKITADVLRVQRITPRLLLIPRFSGQYAFDSLVSGEQFGIGGFNSVVGQMPSAFAGDSGYAVNLEGRYSLFSDASNYQALLRYDYAQTFLKETFIGEDNSQDLSGASVGFILNPNDHINFRVEYALPIGDETDRSNIVYVQARLTY